MSLNPFKGLTPVVNQEFALPQTHRFRGKAVYEDGVGNKFYESWVPEYLDPAPDDTYYEVPRGLEHNLPAISYDIYGTSKLWWMIASVNGIIDPFEDMSPGMLLRIPSSLRLHSTNFLKTR